jgi:hypothetical protein
MSEKHFEYWRSVGHLAEDFEVPYGTANSWVTRGAIPSAYDVRRIQLITEKGGKPDFEAIAKERAEAKTRKSSGCGGVRK